MFGIIGAVNEEAEAIKNEMKYLREEKCGDTSFFKGSLFGTKIVFVQSGVGKVNAAAVTALLIDRYNIRKVIFSGVAGSLDKDVNVGDVVISEDLVQHDFSAVEFGYRKGHIPGMPGFSFKADSELMEKAKKIKADKYRIFFGRILTGDRFISERKEKERLGKEFKALCVDMESAATAQVCQKFNVKFIVIRSISDSLTDDSAMEYSKFVKSAAENSKEILKQILK